MLSVTGNGPTHLFFSPGNHQYRHQYFTLCYNYKCMLRITAAERPSRDQVLTFLLTINKLFVKYRRQQKINIYLFLDKILVPCLSFQALNSLLLLFCLLYVQYLFLSQPTKQKTAKERSWTTGTLPQRKATQPKCCYILGEFKPPSQTNM